MGTKMGGGQYASYVSSRDQSTLDDIGSTTRVETFDDRFEAIAQNKLHSLKPRQREMKELDSFGDKVQETLSEKLKISERHLFGSTVKDTMINTSNTKDVDQLLVLDSQSHGSLLTQPNGPSNALNKVRGILSRSPEFAGAKISVDGNAVTIRQGNKSVDVVPAFRNPNGRGFLIPETGRGNRWIKSDPRTSKRILDIVDRNNYGQVRPLIKLAKDWNERHGKKLKSYHVEQMVIHHFMNRPPDSKRSLHANMDEFFFRLPEYVSSNRLSDPATGERMGGYLSRSTKDKVIKDSLKTRESVKRGRSDRKRGDYDGSLDNYGGVLDDGGGA